MSRDKRPLVPVPQTAVPGTGDTGLTFALSSASLPQGRIFAKLCPQASLHFAPMCTCLVAGAETVPVKYGRAWSCCLSCSHTPPSPRHKCHKSPILHSSAIYSWGTPKWDLLDLNPRQLSRHGPACVTDTGLQQVAKNIQLQ